MSEFNNDFAQRYRNTLPLRYRPGKQCERVHVLPYFLAANSVLTAKGTDEFIYRKFADCYRTTICVISQHKAIFISKPRIKP